MNPAATLVERLAGIGLDWNHLVRRSQAIALFGSRAVGCEHEGSDWDLVCVGRGQTRLVRGLDLVWIDSRQSTDPDAGWAGSELANHVARFGLVLTGELPWVENHNRDEFALARKRRQLDGYIGGMLRVWPLLNNAFRSRQITDLRRELQRHALIGAGESVPPTAVLDHSWKVDSTSSTLRLFELLERAGMASRAMERLLVDPSGEPVPHPGS